MAVFHRGTYTNAQLAAGLFVFLGVLLILGFLLPVAVPDRGSGLKMEFINFTVFEEPRVPAMFKIMCVYPLIAGLAVTVVGAAARGVGRSIPVMLIGVLPVILLFADERARRGIAFIPSHFLGNGIAAFFSLIGFVGLLGGGLALSYQRENRAAAVTAGIAGAAYLLHLFIPINAVRGVTIPLVEPFMTVTRFAGRSTPLQVLIELLTIVQMLLLITTSCIALRYAFISNLRGRKTGSVFRLMVWAMIAGACLVIIVVFNTLSGLVATTSGSAYATAITVLLKMGCWLGGLALLFPVGLADLLLAINKNVHEPQGFDVLMTSSTGSA